ncbi:hypothetical protein BCR32DRAFT_281382 [Anaeromyces robustus]|uniref:Uncharacterized protein n=1 Tax=Anaeromyces robustus TaxID=1754192 RepID=A0A1Y1X109_9FUNG|nr:hypothetical protein BCR32DRAFT_281382 [Anaeromyces robustus]|eukprot:ORX79487.1 hypothetical protein BCR32DRAFT_281382 [Anaeromyces robustus]
MGDFLCLSNVKLKERDIVSIINTGRMLLENFDSMENIWDINDPISPSELR